MKKIKIIKTGEIVDVSNNVAFGLVDSGKAEWLTIKDVAIKPEFKLKVMNKNPRAGRGYNRK